MSQLHMVSSPGLYPEDTRVFAVNQLYLTDRPQIFISYP